MPRHLFLQAGSNRAIEVDGELQQPRQPAQRPVAQPRPVTPFELVDDLDLGITMANFIAAAVYGPGKR